MSWYTPIEFFRRRRDERIRFYCAHYKCKKDLTGERVLAYDPNTGELMHPGDCQELVVAHRVLNSKESFETTHSIIKFKTALRLHKEGLVNDRSLRRD